MKRQVMKLYYNGTITITYESDRKYNPFVIRVKNGNHVTILEKYADLNSCICYLKDMITSGAFGEAWKV